MVYVSAMMPWMPAVLSAIHWKDRNDEVSPSPTYQTAACSSAHATAAIRTVRSHRRPSCLARAVP